MNIPLRFQTAQYEDVPHQIRLLFENMRTSKKGIYIHGDVGVGKTHIAYALKKAYTMPTKEMRYATVWNTTELLREMKMDFDRENIDKRRYEEELMAYKGLLILDDIGTEKISDWVAETFYLIINKRYNDMLPTIFTSNLSIKNLKERLNDRIVSRIVEMCDIIELIGDDKRFIGVKERIKINI